MTKTTLSDLLHAVLLTESSWDANKKDTESVVAVLRLLETGVVKLAAMDPGAAAAVLPRVVHALVPQLASQHELLRRATATALCAIVSAGLQESEVAAAVSGLGMKGKKLSSVQRVMVAVEASLGPQYRDGWEGSLAVAGEVLQRLGRRGAPLAHGLVARIGQLCAGAADLDSDQDNDEEQDEAMDEEHRVVAAAQSTLGIALRTLGPETVLEVLPLHLHEGLAGTEEARTWLLPLLRQHVRHARVGYWVEVLLPLARSMGAQAAAAAKDAQNRKHEASVCATLEMQVWETLPSFCSWAEDVGDVFAS